MSCSVLHALRHVYFCLTHWQNCVLGELALHFLNCSQALASHRVIICPFVQLSSSSAGSAFMDSTNCGSKILKKGKTFRVFQNAKLEFATPWELLAYHLHRIYNYLHNTHIVLHCKQSRDDSKYQGGCAYGREPTSHGHWEMTVALYIHFLYVFIHQLGCPF